MTRLPILAAMLFIAAPSAGTQESEAGLQRNALSLGWMAGCWAERGRDQREVWSEDLGGLLFGYGVARDENGNVTFFEDLRIEEREGGAVYIASPQGAPPTVFTETGRTGLSVTFENPGHDYPQRIEYGANRVALVAKTSMLDGSRTRMFSLYKCDTGAESGTPEP